MNASVHPHCGEVARVKGNTAWITNTVVPPPLLLPLLRQVAHYYPAPRATTSALLRWKCASLFFLLNGSERSAATASAVHPSLDAPHDSSNPSPLPRRSQVALAIHQTQGTIPCVLTDSGRFSVLTFPPLLCPKQTSHHQSSYQTELRFHCPTQPTPRFAIQLAEKPIIHIWSSPIASDEAVTDAIAVSYLPLQLWLSIVISRRPLRGRDQR